MWGYDNGVSGLLGLCCGQCWRLCSGSCLWLLVHGGFALGSRPGRWALQIQLSDHESAGLAALGVLGGWLWAVPRHQAALPQHRFARRRDTRFMGSTLCGASGLWALGSKLWDLNSGVGISGLWMLGSGCQALGSGTLGSCVWALQISSQEVWEAMRMPVVGGQEVEGAQKGEGGQEVEGAHANVDVHEDEGPREHSDSDSDSDSGGGSSALSVDGGGDSATAQDSRQS